MPESTIIMTKAANKLESVMKKKAYAFLEKLAENDAAPGLHIEPIKNSVDKKVRTGRVDQGYRAVLFKLTDGGSNTYVFHGIWPHDDAITVAGKVTLTVNPVNGVAEIRVIDAEAPQPHAAQAAAPPQVAEVDPPILPPEPSVPAAADWSFAVSIDDLVSELGFPPEVAERARCGDERGRAARLRGRSRELAGSGPSEPRHRHVGHRGQGGARDRACDHDDR